MAVQDICSISFGSNTFNLKDSSKYTKPSGGIPASDLASGVIPTVPTAYGSNPAMDGTASAGSSMRWAKGDHVHPTDTSRQAKITVSGILKGNGTGKVSAATPGTDYQMPPVLLWENLTPSNEVTTMDIPIQNLTDYSFLLIEFRLHASHSRSLYALVGTASHGILSGGQGTNYGSRLVNINNNTIEINEFITSRSDLSDQKLRLIPIKIFGINF